MLVLGRRVNQAIFIDGGITIRVVEITEGRVKLAFTAPESVGIWREELLTADRKNPLPRNQP